MAKMCLVPTAGIRSLAEKIRLAYPEACKRNGFSDQMCAEWVGLYNDLNNINNPDNIPSMKSLVNAIEKMRNNEGKSFLRDLDDEFIQMSVAPVEETLITYNLPGQKLQTYTIKGSHIYNKKGDEVYKADDPNAKTHRNRIFANLAVQQGRAVVVEHKGMQYVVNDREDIMSASGNKPGHLMQWGDENGDRKAIISLAQEKLKKNSTTITLPESWDITVQLLNHLKSIGINIHNRAEMVEYLNKHGYNSIQEAVNPIFEIDIDYINSQFKLWDEDPTIREILEVVKTKKYDKSGTDAVTINSDNHQVIYIIDHSSDKELEDNLKDGDGFGIRYAYKLDEIHGENGEQLVHTLIREIAGDYDYSETRIRKVLQNLGVRPENLLGPNLATQLKRMHDDDVVVSRLGRTRGYKTNKNNGGKSSTNDKRGIRQTKENFFITPQGEVYGFAAPNGELYFDETVISPNHPLHEYTHLWDRALAKNNPELWKKGIELMKNSKLTLSNGKTIWQDVEEDPNYGLKWKAAGVTGDKLESLIASEVHAKLVGENGEKLLNEIKDRNKDSNNIIQQLKQWILDAWKNLKASFSNWSQEEIDKLTLADFDHMTVRDFADGINPNTVQQQTQPSNLPSNATVSLSAPVATQPLIKPIRPQSNAFESALKVADSTTARFYNTFSPQQIKDRGAMIAHMFSDIVDEYIDNEIDEQNRIINSEDSSQNQKDDAKILLNTYRDPINGRQFAVDRMQVGNIIGEIKNKIQEETDNADGVKKLLWQNTLDYFTQLFETLASLDIEEQEGIRIVGLQQVEKSVDDVENEEDNDGNDETGHTVTGNDGWLFQIRYEDPAKSLSKKVKRMLYNIERGEEDVDDLGFTRNYPMGQIYASFLSYLSKHMQSADDFMVLKKPKDFTEDDYDYWGNSLAENSEWYPEGYPTFPVLEEMKKVYPWVQQVIQRLTDDFLSTEMNSDLRYPSTFGAMASQFYSNFRKVFIPYGKVQIGENDYFGVTPLNYEMEERRQLEKLLANFNNGLTLTDTSIYNQDTTINRENAKRLVQMIEDTIGNDKVEEVARIKSLLDDEDIEVSDESLEELNNFVDSAQKILNSFGISAMKEDVASLLAMEDHGEVINRMFNELSNMANSIANLSDEKAKSFNYMLDLLDQNGNKVWQTFFQGRGLITDAGFVQSYYDAASKKSKYSYSADNYIQKMFRNLYQEDKESRQAFMDEHFKKYEWFYNHNTNQWRNKWLEYLYNADTVRKDPPYRNVDNITEYSDYGTKIRPYVKWTPDDIWLVQNRSYDTNSEDFAYYLAPIFSDSPMSMTIRGPKMNNEELMNAFMSLVDLELWRIKYVNNRKKYIDNGSLKPIASFDSGRGQQFCFLPELNNYMCEATEKYPQEKFLDRMRRLKEDNDATTEEINNTKRLAILDILESSLHSYIYENASRYVNGYNEITQEAVDNTRNRYYNMVYANASIIQISTIDLAFYKNSTDFQKRFKEVYAGGIEVNTNSRYGKKTENVLLVMDDVITSPSYDNIANIINGSKNLSAADKKSILSTFKDIVVADAQAIRGMHSFRSILDMLGRWDDRMEQALQHFQNNEWNREDFDLIFQTIKPFAYSVIERNDGEGGVIPVPQQHKNSEICALMMYDLITNNLKSPVYEALSEFMENTVGADGKQLIDMIQYESAGKVGNQGVINISCNPQKVIDILNNGIKIGDNIYNFETAIDEKDENKKHLPNDLQHVDKNYQAIKEQLDGLHDSKKISLKEYNETIAFIRPTKDEIISMLEQAAIVKDNGINTINTEVVHTMPFDNYYQQQPTPEHHIDALASFGSQARNIAVADLPQDFTLTFKGKNGNKTFKGRNAVVDFYYELLDENLIEDFFGSNHKKGLKEIFSSKENLRDAVINIVRGNPKYGRDFIDALEVDSNGDFVLSPNSPTMFSMMLEIITSLFKNHITKQKINGAALIQAAGVGLDDSLRLRYDKNGKFLGAECLMPLTSKSFFEPLLERDNEGNMVLNPKKLKEAGLDKAIGYRIPTENKSSMMPLIIKGFTPLQNGSAIVLPAEITAIAGSDFDVDKMYLMLPEFYVQKYNMVEAKRTYEREKDQRIADKFFAAMEKEDIPIDIEYIQDDSFKEWFNDNAERFTLDKPVLHKIEYDFSKSPKENGRKARNNMIIQMMYDILTSKEGSESVFNPQGFPDVENAASMMEILNNSQLLQAAINDYGDNFEDWIYTSSTKTLNEFIKNHRRESSPILPQEFTHNHASNMAGSNLIGIYALQGSIAAKYQRSGLVLRDDRYNDLTFTLNGRLVDRVDASDNGGRLKNVGQMIGASADNGKNPNLTKMGSTNDTAPLIAYMLRLGLSHKEAALIINLPIMKLANFKSEGIKDGPKWHKGNVTSTMLINSILDFTDEELVSVEEQEAINAMCWRILTLFEAQEDLVKISRADSPNGAMKNSFAKVRIQQYKVDLFNAQMNQKNFPFKYNKEIINNKDIDITDGENAVREDLSGKKMAFLQAMHSLGINSLGTLASPYFFMLTKHFDDNIVKPLLYNMAGNNDNTLEDIVNHIYVDYITYVLSGCSLFGDEQNEDGTVTTMKDKRIYYLNNFAEDFVKTLQDNEDIRDLIGNILTRDGNRVVLKDIGLISRGLREEISSRLTRLALSDNPAAKKLAKDLLIYSYYDNGLQFTHDSFSSRFSVQFLTMFDAFTDTLKELDKPLTEELEENFKLQFIQQNYNQKVLKDMTWFNGVNVNGVTHTDDDSYIVDMSVNTKKLTNVALSPNPWGEGVIPYTYITVGNDIYVLDEVLYESHPENAVYRKLNSIYSIYGNPVYNINTQAAELNTMLSSVSSLSNDLITSNASNDNPDMSRSEVDMEALANDIADYAFDDSILDQFSISDQYTNEGNEELQKPMC